jgi:hypothetical protein
MPQYCERYEIYQNNKKITPKKALQSPEATIQGGYRAGKSMPAVKIRSF